DVAELLAGAGLASARADALDGVGVAHDPGADVEVVDVLLDVEVAGEPGVVVPVAHLPGHLAHVIGALATPDGAAQIVGLQGDDLADRPVVDAGDGVLEPVVVPQAQTGDDRQVAAPGLAAGLQNGAHARGIDGARLLGKDMLVGVDRGAQMDGPK